MYVILMVFWFIFNGKVNVEVAALGFVICSFLYWFMCKYMDYSLAHDREVMKKFPLIMQYLWQYLGVLEWEIIKSNLHVMRLILSPKLEVEPMLYVFDVDLKTDLAKVTLANSITLTPGTYTIRIDGDTYFVHALDKSFCDGIEESGFIKRLRKLEE